MRDSTDTTNNIRATFPGAVLGVLCAIVISVLIFGAFAPYWNKAQSNLQSVYEALLYNDGLPQDYVDYPKYISPILLGYWYQLLHLFGILSQYKLSDLSGNSTVPQFDSLWQTFVFWARIHILSIGLAYVLTTMLLIRRLTENWRIAILAGVALAFSDGVALGYRILRSELFSSALVFLALLLVIIAAREGPNGRRYLKLGLAGLFIALALTEKVQALLPALTIPVIALAFGRNEGNDDTPRTLLGMWLPTVVLGLLTLSLIAPTLGLVQEGINGMANSRLFHYRPVFAEFSGLYQWLLVCYVISSMVVYAWLWRVRPIVTASGILAVLVGLSLGLLTLYARYNPNVVVAVANPIEHLHALSATPEARLPTTSIALVGSKFLGGLSKTLAVHTFLIPSHRPTLLIEWLTLYALWLIWRRGQTQVALQIALLLLAAFAVDASFTLRSAAAVKTYYTAYTDPFIVLAGATALTQFASELAGLRAQRAILVFMVGYVIWGNFESARATYGSHSKAKVCKVAAPYVKRMRIPYCHTKPTAKPPVQKPSP
jgi:hypothetical protein